MKKSKRRALGQHFLTNRKIRDRIVNVISPEAGDVIIEIGAGKGALTFILAKSEARVIAIEKDISLVSHLKKGKFDNLTVLEGDALRIQFKDLLHGNAGKIVGNLPYAISSPLLFKILEEKDCVRFCVFLLQREVAERVCAVPGTKKYAPISILFQNEFQTRLHFHVPASAFSPPPRVESALISFKKRRQPLYVLSHQEAFARFLKGAFQNRRKKLSNNLKALKISPPQIREAILACGIDEKLRPEQVSLSQFIALYAALFDEPIKPKSPA